MSFATTAPGAVSEPATRRAQLHPGWAARSATLWVKGSQLTQRTAAPHRCAFRNSRDQECGTASRRFERRRRRFPLRPLVHEAHQITPLPLIAALALGASGLFVALIGWLGGSTSIVNISTSTHLSTADCARWLRNDPHAANCYQAPLSDWASETVVNRLAVGGMALILLLIILLLRSRRPRRTSRLLPPVVVSSIGLSIFGATAMWLIGQAVDTMLIGANGVGQYLGSAPPVLGIALWFAARLVYELRGQPERSRYGEVI